MSGKTFYNWEGKQVSPSTLYKASSNGKLDSFLPEKEVAMVKYVGKIMFDHLLAISSNLEQIDFINPKIIFNTFLHHVMIKIATGWG